MRMLVVLAIVLTFGIGVTGCASKDAHQLYTERMSQLSVQADLRGAVDDFHKHVLMDDTPSHLNDYAQE